MEANIAGAIVSAPRERLTAAMAASIQERGYRETTVADVVRIARTSRRTFYEHFPDRDTCFLALFEQTAQQTIERVAAAVNPAQPWDQQVDCALDAYIASVTERPALQQSFVRELPGLAGVGAARQRALVERFGQLLVDLVESSRRRQPELGARPLPLDVAIIIVGGLRELLVISIEQGRDLHELGDSSRQVVRAILAAVVF
ncbi:MAG: TetR/AcrR family transcriptional regulator [Actinomycetota bacterium]|nr:TetR/AcrR family transcriptional regulator [Actinomycetota bacterium]